MFIDGLRFQPWIGANYFTGGRLLLIGESHYLDDEDYSEDFTTVVIRDVFLTRKEMGTLFFKNTGSLFYSDDYYKIWDEISFANAIQIGFPDAKSQPGVQEIKTIAPAFKLLLNDLKPTKVMVLSKRMWNHWVPEDNGKFVCHISENGKKSTIWEYYYDGGKCLAMGIKHPSWMFGNSHVSWKPMVDQFLAM